jgi:hypothetical protein
MAIVNITTENDADFIRSFAYETVSGSPIDLTGNTMKMGIRKRAEDIAEQMLLTTENGGLEITDPAAGKFQIWITNEQLVLLPVGEYEHSLVRMTGGLTLRIWSGTLTVNAGPSR